VRAPPGLSFLNLDPAIVFASEEQNKIIIIIVVSPVGGDLLSLVDAGPGIVGGVAELRSCR
jgi:hypothetical protein